MPTLFLKIHNREVRVPITWEQEQDITEKRLNSVVLDNILEQYHMSHRSTIFIEYDKDEMKRLLSATTTST